MKEFLSTYCIFLLLLALALPANAVQRSRTGYIQETLITSNGDFGGCMVRLDKSFGNGCTVWATFDCSGEGGFATKDVSYRMLDSAQMAFALGTEVKMWVDDAQKIDGHCMTQRIDLLPAP